MKRKMKLAAVTMVYNEALILPFFLRHYKYLDEIHVLFETDSNDGTLEILRQSPNVIIRNCHIEGGLDDLKKVDHINKTLHGIKADWVYVVDSDEFIFPPDESAQDFLQRQRCDVVLADMFNVFKHRTDPDLNPSLPPVPQRIHGNLNAVYIYDKPPRVMPVRHIKPIVVKPLKRIRFAPGNHEIDGYVKISREFYYGVHWSMADPLIAVRRRIQCRDRMSKRNIDRGMGWHNWNITEDMIMAECSRHLDDPAITYLESLSLVDSL